MLNSANWTPTFSSSIALVCEMYTAAKHFIFYSPGGVVQSRAQLISLHRSVVARVPACGRHGSESKLAKYCHGAQSMVPETLSNIVQQVG